MNETLLVLNLHVTYELTTILVIGPPNGFIFIDSNFLSRVLQNDYCAIHFQH